MDTVNYSVVVPTYNEEQVLEASFQRLTEVMTATGGSYELLFVDDGSVDKTVEILHRLCAEDPHVKMLRFSRNFGQQAAVTAGMDAARGQAVFVIDCDLQDPPEVMLQMIEKWREGYQVVYGKRLERKGESAFKRGTAKLFYRTLNALTDIDIPLDTGEFRLIDRAVCDALKAMPEHNRYVRGLVSWVGFRQTAVEYVREERFAGETKYSMAKMLKLAADGLTSFSFKPIKAAIFFGILVSAAAAVYLIVCLILSGLSRADISAVHYVGGVLFLLNGMLFIALGLLGEYVGRICDEARGRPNYIIASKRGFGPEDK
ncbi:glycosyltransferase family 2 protein [Oscillospiraceae bacterium OttesenSCG-928-F05]|nr:glycosyltransferase family 2 protein [Oscillospiraceae bacterium OttesenSCG-928-F05]